MARIGDRIRGKLVLVSDTDAGTAPAACSAGDDRGFDAAHAVIRRVFSKFGVEILRVEIYVAMHGCSRPGHGN